MKKAFALAFQISAACATFGAQRPTVFVDSQDNHWAYFAVADLRTSIAPDVPPTVYVSIQNGDRRAFARFIAAAVAKERKSKLQLGTPAVNEMIRLLDTFSDDLRLVGVDSVKAKRQFLAVQGGLDVSSQLLSAGSKGADGLHLDVPLFGNRSVDLSYSFSQLSTQVDRGAVLSSTTPASTSNGSTQLQNMGSSLSLGKGPLSIGATYSLSNLLNNGKPLPLTDNSAVQARVGLNSSRFDASVGYDEVQRQYAANQSLNSFTPQVGDVRGPAASMHVKLTDTLDLSANGALYSGMGTSFAADDRISRWGAQIGYKINPALSVSVGLENLSYDLKSRTDWSPDGKARERWYNLGLGYSLNNRVNVKFLWQISDYNGLTTAPGTDSAIPGARPAGSSISTQLTIKF